LFALFEFGHAYMTTQLLKTAAREAARTGVASGKTTADVIARANAVMESGMDASVATVYVKDGDLFDQGQAPPSDYSALPNIEVGTMEERKLFIVRIEVPYDDVSLFPLTGWVAGATLSGQAVMRHE
jgi:hypothetical protein